MRKEFQKKGDRRCWANLASLSAQPAARPASPSPLSPAHGACLTPSRDGHVAAVRRRWARRGRPPPLVGTLPRVPKRSLHSVARALSHLPSSARAAAAAAAPPAPLPEEAPPLAAGRTRAPTSPESSAATDLAISCLFSLVHWCARSVVR